MNYINSLEQAILYIENNLENNITVANVASAASYSYYHFHRFFQAMTGETVGSYIRARRLTKASRELLYTDKRIIDIAVSLQFESHSAFTHAFKNYYKVTPEEYRNNRVETILGVRNPLCSSDLQHLSENITISPEFTEISDMLIVGLRYNTDLSGIKNAEHWEYFNSKHNEIIGSIPDSPRYGIFEANDDCINGNLNEQSTATGFIGIEVNENFSVPDGMFLKDFKGGKYAKFTHKGSVTSLYKSYKYIWGTWLPISEIKIDSRDDFECYTHRYLGYDNVDSEIDIYLPIK